MSVEIKGIETIIGLVGSPPMEIKIDQKLIKSGTSLLEAWNSKHLAFIPYCFKCKEPLNWFNPPTEEGHIFRCPKCDRRWKID